MPIDWGLFEPDQEYPMWEYLGHLEEWQLERKARKLSECGF